MGSPWGGMSLHAVRKDLEEGEPFRAAYRRGTARWLDSTNVGGVANEVTARTRRPMVYGAPAANSSERG